MQNHKTISQAIYQQIAKAQNILLICHQGPDGDALGSNLALLNYLLKEKKQVTSFCLDPAPNFLNFLPNVELLTDDHRIFQQAYDTVIMVDCSNLEYAGVDGLMTAIPSKFTLINIDHHASNPDYGDFNLVLSEASSTAEIVYRLLKDWQADINSEIATSLATGIITDTHGFVNPATNYQTLAATADLKNKGANIHRIVQITLQQLNVNVLQLLGRALARLNKIEKYNLVYTYLTREDFLECEVDDSVMKGVANFLHILKEGEVLMVLREKEDNTIKASLRTTGQTDLAKLAEVFGGGGHQKAAGFSLSGKLVCDNNKLKIV